MHPGLLQTRDPAQREAGDWIIGLSPKERGNRIVYAMQVAEKITFVAYWRDRRFAQKIPDPRSPELQRHSGDNIYEPLGDGDYRQHPGAHLIEEKAKDLSGRFVLVATDFAYFGANAIALPPQFNGIIAARAHRCNFAPELVQGVVEYIAQTGFGVRGMPRKWRPSWSDHAQNGTQWDAAIV